MIKQFYCKQFNLPLVICLHLNIKLFYLTHSEPESNGNEGVLHIPQSSRTGTTPSNSLASYLGRSSERGAFNPLQSTELRWVGNKNIQLLSSSPTKMQHISNLLMNWYSSCHK